MTALQEKYKKHPDHALQAIGVFRILAMDREGEEGQVWSSTT
ncbi:hypothetical protein [Paenibacillus sp. Root52]|nr:hypothetical protein [Paenibacillus sp. Root52]